MEDVIERECCENCGISITWIEDLDFDGYCEECYNLQQSKLV